MKVLLNFYWFSRNWPCAQDESTGLLFMMNSRHSLASHLVAGNVNLALVREALGHRSIRSTMV